MVKPKPQQPPAHFVKCAVCGHQVSKIRSTPYGPMCVVCELIAKGKTRKP